MMPGQRNVKLSQHVCWSLVNKIITRRRGRRRTNLFYTDSPAHTFSLLIPDLRFLTEEKKNLQSSDESYTFLIRKLGSS